MSLPRIGYVPMTEDFSAPGDRRRFVYYARSRGLDFEIADPNREYDVVVLSQAADLSRWIRYDGGRIVFDFIDSYLAETGIRTVLRGAAKYAFRQTRYLHLDYRELLRKMSEKSHAIICSTEAQRKDLLEHCRNVHVILDVHTAAVKNVKSDFARGSVFNLVWEGLPGNIVTFEPIADALRRLQERHPIALHLITDIERPAALRNVGRLPTKRLVRRVLSGIDDVYLYEWNEELFSTICTACDLAIIPIPLDKPIFAGKPENKLVLFWRMNVPVVTSATPAFVGAMSAAGLSMTCEQPSDWLQLLERYMADESLRREAARAGYAHATTEYSEERLLERWDDVFESIGVNVGTEASSV